ncbi:hypothetical protein C0991_012197 [Blastosporella zonata]|nr:hypothetical protein C0991_010245 [Blastosporella zonata]KAG6838897.1 hypothetical protein C0991_007471 [Blastosporella zonata]KAG6860177.1 hypothetical protein C0991_012197 [Blastosporella zonata]
MSSPLPTDMMTPLVTLVLLHPVEWKHDKYNRLDPKADFRTWARRLNLFLSLIGLKEYIFEPIISSPNRVAEPIAHRNWASNNNYARAIVLTTMDEAEQEQVESKKTAAGVFKALKIWAQGKGPVRQLSVICEGLALAFSPAMEPLPTTFRCIHDISRRVDDKAHGLDY